VKRFVLVAALGLMTVIIGCDKQKALDSIMADSQMRSYIMQQMLSDETSRAEMADSILNDATITNTYLDSLVANEMTRGNLVDRIIAVDSTGQWITAKLAENPEIKKEMRKAARN